MVSQPQTQPDDINLSDVQTVSTEFVITSENGGVVTITSTVTVTKPPPTWLSDLINFINYAIVAFVVLFLVALVLLTYYSSTKADLELVEEDIYSSSLSPRRKDIIDLYRDTCYAIEGKVGRAPIWYTPSKFLNSLVIEIGPPLTSYFGVLTELYELARFSSKELTDEHVQEAKEASTQVIQLLKQRRESQE